MQPPDELRDGSRGAGWLNKLRAWAISTRLVEGIGYRLNQTSRGVSLEILPGKGGTSASTIKRYRVKSVADDKLVANEIIGDGLVNADTDIAKPFNLRKTGWHEETVEYLAPGYPGSPGLVSVYYIYQSAIYRIASVRTPLGETTEHQVITPYYLAGSEIVAAEPSNGTGVTGTTLMDMNTDGRAWARAI